MSRIARSTLMIAAVLAGAACQPDAPAPAAVAADAPGDAAAAPLKDVIERTPHYLIGITYPAIANQYPPLGTALRSFSDQARADLLEAVKQAGQQGPSAPYDLSLNFVETLKRPDVVVVSADGSLYTGGAHGIPLIARFTYLPESGRLLKSSDLIPAGAGWKAVSEYARGALRKALDERMEEDDLPAREREELARNAASMIDEGTLPDPANFAQFEPVPSADGKWFGLRFVFPPYQVGPYSDGTQTVEVPASVLKPHLNPVYRDRFTGG